MQANRSRASPLPQLKAPLKTRPWLRQELALFLGGFAPQNRVAMRITTEAVNNGLVLAFEVEIGWGMQASPKAHECHNLVCFR